MKSIISVLLLLAGGTLYCQEYTDTEFKINAEAVLSVPADVINFQIIISEENNSSEMAFNEHKKLEKKLFEMLEDFSVADSDIIYSLLNVREKRIAGKQTVYQTMQRINFPIYNFNKYEKLQISLLNAGISEFKSSFNSTKTDSVKEEIIKMLIKNANREAKIYAENLGMKVERITKIETSTRRFNRPEQIFFVARSEEGFNPLEIPQMYNIKLSAVFTFLFSK